MVARIIDERMADGQFDECDLTLRDIEKIKEAFVPQLLGMYHQRIAYPQNKVVELETRRAAPAAASARARDSRASIYLPPWRIDVTIRDRRRRCPTAGAAPLARAIAAALDAAGAPSPAIDRADPVGRSRAGGPERSRTSATTGPTDVLSFPLLPPEAFPPTRAARSRPAPRGAAAAFSGRPVGGRTSATSSSRSSGPPSRPPRAAAARRATSAGRPADELRLLVTHGTLHICGWDHADPAEEARCAPWSGDSSAPDRVGPAH